MGCVEDDPYAGFLHPGDGSHVRDEIVVAEGGPPLGDEVVRAAEGLELVGYVLNVPRRKKLAFFHIHDPAGAGGGLEQVGLAAEEGGNL